MLGHHVGDESKSFGLLGQSVYREMDIREGPCERKGLSVRDTLSQPAQPTTALRTGTSWPHKCSCLELVFFILSQGPGFPQPNPLSVPGHSHTKRNLNLPNFEQKGKLEAPGSHAKHKQKFGVLRNSFPLPTKSRSVPCDQCVSCSRCFQLPSPPSHPTRTLRLTGKSFCSCI